MKAKSVTPYARLMERFRRFAFDVANRRVIAMWRYPKDKLGDSWRLDDLWERVAAADQIGFEVRLKAKDTGLEVEYVKRTPNIPWDIQ